MRTSSRRVGPTFDTLRVVIQPWPDRVAYTVMRLHHDGSNTTQTREASGSFAMTPADLARTNAVGLLERLLDEIREPRVAVGAPSGAMGGQTTLDLDLTP